MRNVSGYLSTTRPWYVQALSNLNDFQLTDPYPFFDNQTAGISSMTVLFADLQPPPFAPLFTPLVKANGPIPSNRTVLGVFANQVQAKTLVFRFSQNALVVVEDFSGRNIRRSFKNTSRKRL